MFTFQVFFHLSFAHFEEEGEGEEKKLRSSFQAKPKRDNPTATEPEPNRTPQK